MIMFLAVATIRITTGIYDNHQYDDVVYVKMLSDEKEITAYQMIGQLKV